MSISDASSSSTKRSGRKLSGLELAAAARAATLRVLGPAAPASRPSRNDVANAVRLTLQLLGEVAPGNSVEMRVPPFGAVQCVAGPKHRRGTPPNVVQCDVPTWLGLVTGAVSWAEFTAHASGTELKLPGALDALTGLPLPPAPAEISGTRAGEVAGHLPLLPGVLRV